MKIFVCSTGRCGTLFMAEVFNYMTDIPSFHEPHPRCINVVMKEVNNSEELSEDTKFILDEKIGQIKQCSDKEGNYFESNNMFIKSYVDKVLNSFDDVYCIHLYRNPLEVFFSFSQKNSALRLDWILRSYWKRNLIKLTNGLSPYGDILWQWFEVRKRFYYYKSRFVKTYDFDFRNINNLDEYYKLFNHFDIKAKKIDALPDFPKNAKVSFGKKSVCQLFLETGWDWDKAGIEWGFPTDIEYHKQLKEKKE